MQANRTTHHSEYDIMFPRNDDMLLSDWQFTKNKKGKQSLVVKQPFLLLKKGLVVYNIIQKKNTSYEILNIEIWGNVTKK